MGCPPGVPVGQYDRDAAAGGPALQRCPSTPRLDHDRPVPQRGDLDEEGHGANRSTRPLARRGPIGTTIPADHRNLLHSLAVALAHPSTASRRLLCRAPTGPRPERHARTPNPAAKPGGLRALAHPAYRPRSAETSEGLGRHRQVVERISAFSRAAPTACQPPDRPANMKWPPPMPRPPSSACTGQMIPFGGLPWLVGIAVPLSRAE
jgi:hypothetical protein